MADDDTFDIDIYGDVGDGNGETQTDQQQQDTENLFEGEEDGLNGIDYSYDGAPGSKEGEAKPTSSVPEKNDTSSTGAQKSATTATASAPISAPQGVKRKAPDDDEPETHQRAPSQPFTTQSDSRPLDPGATNSLRLNELQWWTTEEDIRAFCASAQSESELRDLSFGEHKINGKSKGEAYLEFTTPQAATATKREMDKAGREGSAENGGAPRKPPFTVFYAPPSNPFRTTTGAAAGAKKDYGGGANAGGMNHSGGRGGGGYNNYNSRGNFGGNRGGGFRGGFNNNNNALRGGMAQQQGNWGMNGGAGPMGGFGTAANPMMANFGMNLPAFNMGRGGPGGMMGGGMNMMGAGRGGFGMGAMNMMGAMAGRGGVGGMMGRGGGGWNGGWNNGGAGGGMQQQNFGGGGGGGGYQQGNKRAKME